MAHIEHPKVIIASKEDNVVAVPTHLFEGSFAL